MSNKKVLVVDDEEHIVELLKYNLIEAGYDVITASDGIEAMNKIVEEKPKIVLLDLMIPGKDGLDVCKEIRSNKEIANIPVIMLTAKSEELDKILGLELGADDYVTKPFSIRELLARVKALLRRSSTVENFSEEVQFGELSAEFEKRIIKIKGEVVDLTLKEFELLEILVRNKGKILTREMLLEKIWGYEYIGETRTVDVHIRYLRKKIEENDKSPKFIETIRGVGYRFNPNN